MQTDILNSNWFKVGAWEIKKNFNFVRKAEISCVCTQQACRRRCSAHLICFLSSSYNPRLTFFLALSFCLSSVRSKKKVLLLKRSESWDPEATKLNKFNFQSPGAFHLFLLILFFHPSSTQPAYALPRDLLHASCEVNPYRAIRWRDSSNRYSRARDIIPLHLLATSNRFVPTKSRYTNLSSLKCLESISS